MFPLEEDVSRAERTPFFWSFREPVAPGNEGPGDISSGRSDPAGVKISDILVTPDLSVILSSDISLTGGGKAVIIGGLASIGFGPMRLFNAGSLTNVGSRMALTDDGILVSTDRVYVSGVTTSENGVHIATFRETGLIPRPPATLTKVVEVASGTPTQEETTEDIPINVMVVPFDTGVTQAVLEIMTNGVAAMPPITLPLVNNQVVWKLAKGFKRVLDGATTALMHFIRSGDHTNAETAPVEVPIGTIRIRLDSNNDTIVASDGSAVDQKDEQASAQGTPFALWEADTSATGENILLDYATLSLRSAIQLQPTQRIALRLLSRTWDVRVKDDPRVDNRSLPADCPPEKAYLCDPATATEQLSIITDNGPGFFTKLANRATSWLSLITGHGLPAELPRITPRDGGVVEVPQELLAPSFPMATPGKRIFAGEVPFLFKVMPQPTSMWPGPPIPLNEVVEVGRLKDNGDFVKLSQANIKIRPLNQMVSVYNARQEGKFDPAPQAVSMWAPIPPEAKRVTVLVHGFNVAKDEALNDFVPKYFKRLYWAGHDVHDLQCQPTTGCAHTIGFVWPGDEATGLPLSGLFLFPEDEFHALQAGVPFARFLKEEVNPNSDRVVTVIAHSLGNMVVNSGLMQPDAAGRVSRYIMNEAALPAEALNANYVYDGTEVSVMFPHAIQHGFSGNPYDACNGHDSVWITEWDDVVSGRPPDLVPDYTQPPIPGSNPPVFPMKAVPNYDDFNAWNSQVQQDTHLLSKPQYDIRWGQNRTTPCHFRDPQRGPWRGYFADNFTSRHPNMRTLNTYNVNDQVISVTEDASIDVHQAAFLASWAPFLPVPVVGKVAAILAPDPVRMHSWYVCQRLQKPRILGSTLGPSTPWSVLWGRYDDRKVRYWADLSVGNTATKEYLWPSGGDHSNVTRQWAELAFWFPALSKAAGNKQLLAPGIQDEDFGRYVSPAGRLDLGGVDTHGYMIARPLSEVWGGYRRVRVFAAEGR